MSKNRAAILGTGQTKYVAKRHDVTMSGMIREGHRRRARRRTGIHRRHRRHRHRQAPDLFEGVMMPELFMAESLGAVGKRLDPGAPPDRWAGRLPMSRRR